MFRFNIIIILFIAILIFPLVAETGGLAGPKSGVVFDQRTRAIRPIIGIPGAAYLGASIAGPLDSGFVSGDGSRALAAAGNRLYLIRGLETGALDRVELGELTSPLDRVAWSEDGSAAATYSGGRIVAWRGLIPGEIPVSVDLGAAASLGGDLTALATGGGAVLVGIKGAGLYLLLSDQGPALLASGANVTAVAVANEGADVYMADRERQEVVLISNYRGNPDTVFFAGAGQGVADPVALAVSSDGRTLTVANAGGRSLLTFDRASRALERRIDLDFEPSRLDAAGSVLLLNACSAPGEVLQVYSAHPDTGVYFVPAPAEEELQ